MAEGKNYQESREGRDETGNTDRMASRRKRDVFLCT